MSINSSLSKSSKEEIAALAECNKQLQELEEEIDDLVTQVNEHRNSTPEVVLALFSLMKEARLQQLSAVKPEAQVNVEFFEKAEEDIENLTKTAILEEEEQQLIHDLKKMKALEEVNKRHGELLYSGLTRNSAVVLPGARFLSKLEDISFE